MTRHKSETETRQILKFLHLYAILMQYIFQIYGMKKII
jgi:hypothetical protein